jgi:hypothetical protein
MPKRRMRKRGNSLAISLPQNFIVGRFGLEPGDYLVFSEREDGVFVAQMDTVINGRDSFPAKLWNSGGSLHMTISGFKLLGTVP